LAIRRPVALVLPELHLEAKPLERRSLAQVLVQHARESLEARIDAGERRQLVERPVAEPGDGFLERGLEIDDVGEVAVAIEVFAAQQHLNLVVMAVLVVLRAPVAADEEVTRDEVARDGQSVHGTLQASTRRPPASRPRAASRLRRTPRRSARAE